MVEFNATFLIALISFAVFIIIMNAIFYNPILSVIRKREEYIKSNYETAQTTVNKAQENENLRNKELEQARSKCKIEIKNSIEQAQEISNQKTHQSREKSKEIINEKKEILNIEGQKIELQIQNDISDDLAEMIMTKVMTKENQKLSSR